MKYRPRIYYTDSDKELTWDRWQKGESLHAIARLFDRSHGSIAGKVDEWIHRGRGSDAGDVVSRTSGRLCWLR